MLLFLAIRIRKRCIDSIAAVLVNMLAYMPWSDLMLTQNCPRFYGNLAIWSIRSGLMLPCDATRGVILVNVVHRGGWTKWCRWEKVAVCSRKIGRCDSTGQSSLPRITIIRDYQKASFLLYCDRMLPHM